MQIKNVFLVLALGVSSIAAQAGDQPQLQPRQLDVDACNDCQQRCRNDRGRKSKTSSWAMMSQIDLIEPQYTFKMPEVS
ncbi:hypothetical protein WAI453_012020 [Rhynchosporium graminicola]